MIELSHYRASARARAGGFTLLEVMIAVVITAIGLLGIAKMQALAYASTGTASMRSLVAIQASGLAASMHADRAYWSLGSAPTVITITNTTITDNGTNTLGTTATAQGYCVSATSGGSGGAPCDSPAVMAAYDLHTWANALAGPGGMLANLNPVTTISCPTISIPITCTIQVVWNERAVGINNQGSTNTQVDNTATAASTATFAPTYILYVEP
ncbi:MAG: prepilin-type N-terminal cleavage/methylation domain-containing protein [Steroidobacteraceae bacterium]